MCRYLQQCRAVQKRERERIITVHRPRAAHQQEGGRGLHRSCCDELFKIHYLLPQSFSGELSAVHTIPCLLTDVKVVTDCNTMSIVQCKMAAIPEQFLTCKNLRECRLAAGGGGGAAAAAAAAADTRLRFK